MPYISQGRAVVFEDTMTELLIITCLDNLQAAKIAGALNDAVKWREHQARVNAEQPKQSQEGRMLADFEAQERFERALRAASARNAWNRE